MKLYFHFLLWVFFFVVGFVLFKAAFFDVKC